VLIIFGGLPGVGKTTLARELARQSRRLGKPDSVDAQCVGRWEYHPWDRQHLVIGTANRSVEPSVTLIREMLAITTTSSDSGLR
jgi:adenylate kinase family enzyme